MKKTLATLALLGLGLTACNSPTPDVRSSSAPSAVESRAAAGTVPTTTNSPGASPMNDSNSASATGGPGTGSVTRRR